ncbi:unnamed protein product [Rhizopus microsporus]
MHLAYFLNKQDLIQQLLEKGVSNDRRNKLGHLPADNDQPKLLVKDKLKTSTASKQASTSERFRRLRELAESHKDHVKNNKSKTERQNSTRRYFRPGHLEERKRRVLSEEEEAELREKERLKRQKEVELLAQRSAVKNNPLFKKFEGQQDESNETEQVKATTATTSDSMKAKTKFLNAAEQVKRSSRVINILKDRSVVSTSVFRQQTADAQPPKKVPSLRTLKAAKEASAKKRAEPSEIAEETQKIESNNIPAPSISSTSSQNTEEEAEEAEEEEEEEEREQENNKVVPVISTEEDDSSTTLPIPIEISSPLPSPKPTLSTEIGSENDNDKLDPPFIKMPERKPRVDADDKAILPSGKRITIKKKGKVKQIINVHEHLNEEEKIEIYSTGKKFQVWKRDETGHEDGNNDDEASTYRKKKDSEEALYTGAADDTLSKSSFIKGSVNDDAKESVKKDVKDNAKEDIKDNAKDIQEYAKMNVEKDVKKDVKGDMQEYIKEDSKDVKANVKKDTKKDAKEYAKEVKEDVKKSIKEFFKMGFEEDIEEDIKEVGKKNIKEDSQEERKDSVKEYTKEKTYDTLDRSISPIATVTVKNSDPDSPTSSVTKRGPEINSSLKVKDEISRINEVTIAFDQKQLKEARQSEDGLVDVYGHDSVADSTINKPALVTHDLAFDGHTITEDKNHQQPAYKSQSNESLNKNIPSNLMEGNMFNEYHFAKDDDDDDDSVLYNRESMHHSEVAGKVIYTTPKTQTVYETPTILMAEPVAVPQEMPDAMSFEKGVVRLDNVASSQAAAYIENDVLNIHQEILNKNEMSQEGNGNDDDTDDYYKKKKTSVEDLHTEITVDSSVPVSSSIEGYTKEYTKEDVREVVKEYIQEDIKQDKKEYIHEDIKENAKQKIEENGKEDTEENAKEDIREYVKKGTQEENIKENVQEGVKEKTDDTLGRSMPPLAVASIKTDDANSSVSSRYEPEIALPIKVKDGISKVNETTIGSDQKQLINTKQDDDDFLEIYSRDSVIDPILSRHTPLPHGDQAINENKGETKEMQDVNVYSNMTNNNRFSQYQFGGDDDDDDDSVLYSRESMHHREVTGKVVYTTPRTQVAHEIPTVLMAENVSIPQAASVTTSIEKRIVHLDNVAVAQAAAYIEHDVQSSRQEVMIEPMKDKIVIDHITTEDTGKVTNKPAPIHTSGAYVSDNNDDDYDDGVSTPTVANPYGMKGDHDEFSSNYDQFMQSSHLDIEEDNDEEGDGNLVGKTSKLRGHHDMEKQVDDEGRSSFSSDKDETAVLQNLSTESEVQLRTLAENSNGKNSEPDFLNMPYTATKEYTATTEKRKSGSQRNHWSIGINLVDKASTIRQSVAMSSEAGSEQWFDPENEWMEEEEVMADKSKTSISRSSSSFSSNSSESLMTPGSFKEPSKMQMMNETQMREMDEQDLDYYSTEIYNNGNGSGSNSKRNDNFPAQTMNQNDRKSFSSSQNEDGEGEILIYMDNREETIEEKLEKGNSTTITIIDKNQVNIKEEEATLSNSKEPRIEDISHYMNTLPKIQESTNIEQEVQTATATREKTNIPDAHEMMVIPNKSLDPLNQMGDSPPPPQQQQQRQSRPQHKHGKIYIGVSGAHDMLLPLPKEITYVRCVISDGEYEYMSRYEVLGHQILMDYECIIDSKPGMIITVSLHVRPDYHVKPRTGWTKWFTSIRKQKEHLSGYVHPEDGAIGQTRFAVDHMVPACYKKTYEANFDCFNSWYTRSSKERQRREQFGDEEDFLKIVGKLNIEMLYLPVSDPDVHVPKSLRECDLTLKILQWHDTCWKSGYLSTRLQGQKIWQRHYYRLIGSQLIGYTTDNEGNILQVWDHYNIADVIRLSAAADKVVVTLIEQEMKEDRVFGKESIHQENLKGFFRLSFTDYYLDCLADEVHESEEWVKAFKSMIGRVPLRLPYNYY